MSGSDRLLLSWIVQGCDQVNYTAQKAWKALHFVMLVLKKKKRKKERKKEIGIQKW